MADGGKGAAVEFHHHVGGADGVQGGCRRVEGFTYSETSPEDCARIQALNWGTVEHWSGEGRADKGQGLARDIEGDLVRDVCL